MLKYLIFWENLKEGVSENLISGIIFTFGFLSILFLLSIPLRNKKIHDKAKIEIIAMGYEDIADIQVFLKRGNWSFKDFIKSKGLRKQYEFFMEGQN